MGKGLAIRSGHRSRWTSLYEFLFQNKDTFKEIASITATAVFAIVTLVKELKR